MKLYLTEDEALALWWRVSALSTGDNDLMNDDEAQLIVNAQKALNAILLSWKENREARTPDQLIHGFPTFFKPNPLFARYIRLLATALMEPDIRLDLTFPEKARIHRLLIQLADSYRLEPSA
jgi:hypothetical protein